MFDRVLNTSLNATLRSSRPEVFCKKGIPRKFVKLTGKHPCQSLFFNKVPGLRSATLLKKRHWHWCFPVSFTNFLGTPFFIEHLWWLLLYPAALICKISLSCAKFQSFSLSCHGRIDTSHPCVIKFPLC